MFRYDFFKKNQLHRTSEKLDIDKDGTAALLFSIGCCWSCCSTKIPGMSLGEEFTQSLENKPPDPVPGIYKRQ